MASPSQPSRPTFLQIDTRLDVFDTTNSSETAQTSVTDIPSATSRGRARSFSQAILPSFRKSAPGTPTQTGSGNPSLNSAQHPDQSHKYLDESRKLLTHVLDRLKNRPKPPSLFDSFRADRGFDSQIRNFRTAVRVVQGAVRLKGNVAKGRRQQTAIATNDSDSEDEKKDHYSTDVTFDLMTQLVSALAVAVKGNWKVFKDENSAEDPFRTSLSLDPYHSNLKPTGRRSRSPSLTRAKPSLQGSDLLAHCIRILSSVISEDCRFQISRPRPSRPPNALQSVALDVASCLLHMHRRDPEVISRVVFAVIPAFYTFKDEMHSRLLAFFEDVVIRPMLDSLRQAQGTSAGIDLVNPDMKEDTSMIQIHVEGEEDSTVLDNSTWKHWSSSSSSNILSTNAPSQALVIYYLSSIIPPLLGAIMDNIDILDTRIASLHRFYRLFETIVDKKPDSYLDVLEVVAYHSPQARYSSIILLMSYWPRGLGHGTIAKPLPIVNPFDFSGRPTVLLHEDSYEHQFVPWRFTETSRSTLKSLSDCWACGEAIRGFGLLCPFCLCAVHFDCYDYPEGGCFSQYSSNEDTSSSKIAVHRFCHVFAPRRHDNFETKLSHHTFRLVNLFTLSLCFLCKKPLWGNVAQGLKCSVCNQFAHSTCLSQKTSDLPNCGSKLMDASCVVIDWSSLRQSFVDHYDGFILKSDRLDDRSYEEVSVLFAALWTQLQILQNGVALGSIVIDLQTASKVAYGKEQHDQFGVMKFELHHLVQLYESFLTSGNLKVSPFCSEYFEENNIVPKEHLLCFDWSTLVYIATVMKSPIDTMAVSNSSSSDLLNVDLPETLAPPSVLDNDDLTQTYEVASLAHIRDAFGIGLQISSDAAARHLMTHMQSLGFLERLDLQVLWMNDGPSTDHEAEYCNFPLPLGLDLSTDVETLTAAIEACLLDLDLSVNEVGLLLLVRRFPYDRMITQNALSRLARSLLAWIFAEDDSLATILRDYVPRRLPLPGVRSLEGQPWPSGISTSRTPSISSNNGRVYIDYRRELLVRYAARWMCSLHDHDRSAYAEMLFQLSADLAEENVGDLSLEGTDPMTKIKWKKAKLERHLRCLIQLGQSAIIFTVFEDVFAKWLELIPHDHRQSYPTLARLFSREPDRFSTSADGNSTVDLTNVNGVISLNPWKFIMKVASADGHGLQQALRWLCILSRSGVEVPMTTFMEFSSLTQRANSSWEDSCLLVEALFCATWLRSLGRQELQSIISSLQFRVSTEVLDVLRSTRPPKAVTFLRQSLVVCLLLYGCDRTELISLGMVDDAEISDLPSRRKLQSRGLRPPDFIGVDSALVELLRRYVDADIDEITVLVARFLNVLIRNAPLLEHFEVDNIIIRNSVPLAACAWEFYGKQRKELTTLRPGILVRLLAVETEPFKVMWEESLSPTSPWETRLEAVLRLFRIILDINSFDFRVDDRQWRLHVIDIFFYYFSAAWADQREEIRLAVDTWSQTLLPSHFEAISACWNETLATVAIPERVKLVTFLIQLLPHFPDWQVLSWEIIVEALLEDDYNKRLGDSDDGPASAHLSMYGISSKANGIPKEENPDALLFRSSLLLLGLQLIWHGSSIDLTSLLRIKLHLTKSLGFQEVAEIPSANGQAFFVQFSNLGNIPNLAFSSLDEMMNVLDAYRPFDLAPSAIGGPSSSDDIKSSLLVGSVFVDVLLTVFNDCDLESLPILTLKNMVKCIMIIAYKHDLESKPLRHLQNIFRKAIRRTIDLFEMDISYEIRQLAFSACQTCIRRWPNMVGSLICDSLETAANVIVSLKHNEEDEVVIEARSFIATVLKLFSLHSLFNTLCKRHLDQTFFVVLQDILNRNATTAPPQESLRDLLLRDTLSRAAENDVSVFQLVLDNIRSYVEFVHHSGYSEQLMHFVGLQLTNITRRTAEWPYSSFDASSLLLLSSILIQNNRAQSRELIMYLENILRVILCRFHASVESLKSIFRVTSLIYKRYNAQNKTGNTEVSTNAITTAILELLSDGLRGKTRVPSSTLASIVEVVIDSHEDIPLSSLLRYAEDGIFYLLTYSPNETYSQSDFAASEAVAKLVVLFTDRDLPSLKYLIFNLTVESSRSTFAVRAWNFLMLTALKSKSTVFASILCSHFQSFTSNFQTSLRHYVQFGSNPQDFAAADINRAFVAVKLWILVTEMLDGFTQAEKSKEDEQQFDFTTGNHGSVMLIWNELWPPFERLVNLFAVEAQHGVVLPVANLVWSSVAELFLFLRQARVTVALDTVSQISLMNTLRPFIRGDSSKFSRVVRSISTPLEEVTFDALVNQAASDILAAEKLHVLESWRKERTTASAKRSGTREQRSDWQRS